MENVRLLWDAFNVYYKDGMNALEANNYTNARRNILCASETLLKLARNSEGALKQQRQQRAQELFDLAEKIENKRKEVYLGRSNNASSDAAKFECNTSSTSNTTTSKTSRASDEETPVFKPSAKPTTTLDDVAGLDDAKEEIRRMIIEPRRHPELFKKFKKNKGGGILLYGAPGTGKTMVAQAIANELDATFFSVKCSDIASKWFGDSEQKVKALFAEARKYPCSIIFFDEFEALGAKRDSYSTVMKRLVPELLAQMQGFEQSENTLVLIGATNRPWDVDSAFLRPGRFSTQIYVPLPDEKARRTIVTKELAGIPIAPDFDINKVIKVTDKFNGADVVEFCNKLKDPALDRSIESGQESVITNQDIDLAALRVRSSVRKEDIEKIRKYEQDIGKA